MENEVDHSDEIALYSKRWFLLGALSLFSMQTQFLSSTFGTSNEIIGAYFNASLLQLDVAMEGVYVGAALFAPAFAYFCFKDQLGFRIMTIVGTTCLLFSCLVIIFSVVFPVLFPFMLVTVSAQGIAFLISVSVGTFFPVLWFPEEEVDIAVAWNMAGDTFGVLVGSILPVIFLKPPPANETVGPENKFSDWKLSTHRTLLIMYSMEAVLLCLLLVFFVLFAKNFPPKPPTFALLLKRNARQTAQRYFFYDFLTQCKTLFTDIHFFLMTCVLSVSYYAVNLMMFGVTQIADSVVSDTHKLSPALFSGLLVMATTSSAIIATFVVAKCLKRFKIYLRLCNVGSFTLFANAIVVCLSFHYKSMTGLFIATSVLGLGTRSVVVPLLVVVTRHTYPISESFVSIWITGFSSAILVLSALSQRLLSNAFSHISIPIFQTVLFFLSFVLSLLIKPKNKRENANEAMVNEHTPILTSDP